MYLEIIVDIKFSLRKSVVIVLMLENMRGPYTFIGELVDIILLMCQKNFYWCLSSAATP